MGALGICWPDLGAQPLREPFVLVYGAVKQLPHLRGNPFIKAARGVIIIVHCEIDLRYQRRMLFVPKKYSLRLYFGIAQTDLSFPLVHTSVLFGCAGSARAALPLRPRECT